MFLDSFFKVSKKFLSFETLKMNSIVIIIPPTISIPLIF